MNPDLDLLQPYPFERLAGLLKGVKAAPVEKISLSIGEPRHPAPALALEALIDNLASVEIYPSTKGSQTLREAMAAWLTRRFKLVDALDPSSQVLPVNGTREALFAIAQSLLDRNSSRRKVLMPNPFYQIYEGATFLAGLEPQFYDGVANAAQGPDFHALDEQSWAAIQMIYICNPGNPTGSSLSQQALEFLVGKADQYGFIIVSDECYSEIYRQQQAAPIGLLQAASAMGNNKLKNCLVFHSLSKRSNLPGLRSGLVAGDAKLIKQFLHYRTYHGSAMPSPTQHASIAAWSDESHVEANRALYDEKYESVLSILDPVLEVEQPAAGFYLWPKLPMDDELFTRAMLEQYNVAVVPGSYLARTINGHNPGSCRSRLALVAPVEQCVEAAQRIREFVTSQ